MDVMGIRMDKIQQCAQNFLNLVSTTKYVFHVAKRGVKVLTLDFDLKDFHHLVGLQYLDDINIPKNKKKTIDSAVDKSNKADYCMGKCCIFGTFTFALQMTDHKFL